MVLRGLRAVADDNVAFAIGGQPAGCPGVAGGSGSDLFVVEADESDGSLVLYEPTVAVITHAELDHVDYFHAPDALDAVYHRFAAQAKHAAIVPVEAQDRLAGDGVDARTFGLEAEADYRATEVQPDGPDAMTFLLHTARREPVRVRLTAGGMHNVLNALAALASIDALGLDLVAAAASLDGFRLPGRRFEVAARARGITVVSDYAHHPTEIDALITQARQLNPARLIGVFQPHRYSRTLQFADRFSDALAALDQVHLVPVYSTSEPFIEGGTSENLLDVMNARGMTSAVAHPSLEAAWDAIRSDLREGDVFLVIGAGDVDRIAAWAAKDLKVTS
jgi:UDP-N-acetylmuramate--alanine ligase